MRRIGAAVGAVAAIARRAGMGHGTSTRCTPVRSSGPNIKKIVTSPSPTAAPYVASTAVRTLDAVHNGGRVPAQMRHDTRCYANGTIVRYRLIIACWDVTLKAIRQRANPAETSKPTESRVFSAAHVSAHVCARACVRRLLHAWLMRAYVHVWARACMASACVLEISR